MYYSTYGQLIYYLYKSYNEPNSVWSIRKIMTETDTFRKLLKMYDGVEKCEKF